MHCEKFQEYLTSRTSTSDIQVWTGEQGLSVLGPLVAFQSSRYVREWIRQCHI